MVALLVGLSIMSVMMTVAMPVWTQAARREREAELVFRGEQYKRAIALFQRVSGPGRLPPSLDVLVDGRFLRKKYVDPITGGDFLLIRQGGSPQTAPGTESGGIVGVVSASRQRSIRLYGEGEFYNEWQFIHAAQTQTPGETEGGARSGQPPRNPPSGSNGAGRGAPPAPRQSGTAPPAGR
jgi:type II secretory pathway pseudopilin PulG